MPSKFLILCATGNQGQAVVTLAQLPGVKVIKASADNQASIKNAIQAHGPIHGAFLVSPPLVPDEIESGLRTADLFRELGVMHLVYSGVDLCGTSSLPLENFEKKRPIIRHIKTKDSPAFRTTIIGPVTFMDNFIALPNIFLPSVLGVWRSGHKRKLFYSQDVGRAAAICLADPDRYGGLDISLAGDELTPEEIAAAFSEVKGVQLPVKEKPLMPPFLAANFKYFDENTFSANVAQCREMFPMTDFRTFLATRY